MKKIFGSLILILILSVAFFYNGTAPAPEILSGILKEETDLSVSSSETSKKEEKEKKISETETKNETKKTKNEAKNEEIEAKNEEKQVKQEKNEKDKENEELEKSEANENDQNNQNNEINEVNNEKDAEKLKNEEKSTEKSIKNNNEKNLEKMQKKDENVEKNDEKNSKNFSGNSDNKNEEEQKSKKNLTCTLSVRCDTLLSNIEMLKSDKVSLVPKNGIIYSEREVVFYENESVFNVLRREMKQNKIHLEFVMTPVFGSAYIEGINNIYEFDCGELSGWMYKVNGEFPKFGCSQYILNDGDKIEWLYTCDLGRDVGENYGIGKQKDE